MEMIINFLSNPRTTGLHIQIYEIELSKIAEFIDDVNENYIIEDLRKINGIDVIKRFVELEEREEKSGNQWISDRLSTAIASIIRKEVKPEIYDYFKISSEDLEKARPSEGYPGFRRVQRLITGFFDPKLFPKYLEVLYMNYRMSKVEKNMVIELISLNEIGFKIFNDFISCLPVLNDSFEKISERESHIERYIFKLYDMVVKLWIDLENKFLLNDNIKDFLTASINYYANEEWRTSVILSSIAVESIFAELYEEEYMINAPDIPLGGLITKVEEKISFPSDLMEKIQGLNKARIASVHRSENPVSSKDAIISMMGITSLIIWYFDNY